MRFDKTVNFSTFLTIFLVATLQNGMAQNLECYTDTFTIYPNFLSGVRMVIKKTISIKI